MQRIRICYLITKSNFGGAQKYVYELATSLPREHYDVTVALGGDGILKTKLERAGISTITIPHLERDISIMNELRVFSFLYTLFRQKKFNIVHVNSSKIGGLGSLAARLAHVQRIIFTAHGFAFNEHRSPLSKLILKKLYWLTMILAHNTIAVSHAIKQQVQHWPLISRKITVIHNGVHPLSFLDKHTARDALAHMNPALDTTKPWIGTLAELHHIKGLDVLLSAAEKIHATHPEYQFVIIGEGEKRTALTQAIQDKNLEKTFILMGFIDNAATYMHAFELFTLPSRSEALALTILEAGLAKLPVVASRVGGIPEIITDHVSGILVPTENIDALYQALHTLISQTSLQHTYAQALHEKVTTHFSYEQMLEKTLGLYTL